MANPKTSTGKVVTSELALGPPSLKRSPNIFNKHNVAIFPQVAEGGDVEGQAAAACPQDNSAPVVQVIFLFQHNLWLTIWFVRVFWNFSQTGRGGLTVLEKLQR